MSKKDRYSFKSTLRLWRQTLNSAKAAVAKSEAGLRESRARIERYGELVKINAISKQVYDQAVATLAQDEAEFWKQVGSSETAELNLGYAQVNAPISGRIGKALVTEGALVTAVEATQLAVIRQLDPVYLILPNPVPKSCACVAPSKTDPLKALLPARHVSHSFSKMERLQPSWQIIVYRYSCGSHYRDDHVESRIS